MPAVPAATPTLTWDFPLPRPHCGVPLGNGVQGVLVWGEDALCLTIGRAGFWDHRGGNEFSPGTTYRQVRRLLEAGDEEGLRTAFEPPRTGPGRPGRPTQVGGGRLVLRTPGFVPASAALDAGTGTLRVRMVAADGRAATAVVRQAMDAEQTWVELDDALLSGLVIELIPSWRWVGDELAAVGVQPPTTWGDARGGGFCQTLPEDAPLAIAWARDGARVAVATALGHGREGAEQVTARARAGAAPAASPAAAARAQAWWAAYWNDVPRVALPDPALQHVWDLGLVKQAGLTTPGGVAATLQGPWLEEYQLPPWSCDYHFNINVEMIYWPCLASNRTAHLQPMWEMIKGWLPSLTEHAARFFGAPGALMLPHAVDDRCRAVGTFWTGIIDHACTAWMAQMAWLHYRHSMDVVVLRDTAWPLLKGAFEGYWAMLEEVVEDGRRRLSLPVSVSPEFKGCRMDAWGRDASFQLAALHCLARILPQAAGLLGQPVDPRWARIGAELPPYTTITASAQRDYPEAQATRIALWQGMDLLESHRHHSHLGAIWPFRTVDPADPAHAAVVQASMAWWVRQGAGMWSGWCVPWAAVLHARCGRADAAVSWLHWWRDVFTNIGHGTLHDADYAGVSMIHAGNQEIMQSDAGMGALVAIQELLVQVRAEDEIAVLPALPRAWRALRFDGILTEGAFLVGATVAGGRTVEVRVTAKAGGRLRLRHGVRGGRVAGQPVGEVLERPLAPGETVVVTG